MKTDKQIKDIADRLNAISSSNNGNGNGHDDNSERDDDYYLDLGRDPPRFYLYRQARAEKWEASGTHGPSDYDDTITQDELDYALKRRLRMTPEQRYQDEKEHYYFHDLYYLKQTVDDNNGKVTDIVTEYGCGYNGKGCVPECKYYAEYGRIENEEIIEDHNKVVEYYRQNNKIVEPPSEIEMQRLANNNTI